ncbi:MAG: hypothetical protein ACMZ7B_07550 [Balneola sp.]
MRIKKIRGHKRIWKRIDEWRDTNLKLDIENLLLQHRDYTKIRIHPFSSISVLNSYFPEPKGKTKKKILAALLDIYDSWKSSLDSLNEPYYLKIWLYEPEFSSSQVVCSLRSCLNFYDQTFFKPDDIPDSTIKTMKKSLPENFNWTLHLDELHLKNNEIGSPEDYYSEEEYLNELNWFNKEIKKAHRTSTFKDSNDEIVEYFSFKKGFVWLGDRTD